MKKIADVLLTIFSIGIILALFAGGASVIIYIVAMFIGGEAATEICTTVFKEYLPWVIKFTSIFTLVGFVGMYFAKVKALTVGTTKSEEESSK